MRDDPKREDPKQRGSTDAEADAWERLDDNDERDEGVIAADDTGMLRGEATITTVTSAEEPGGEGAA